MYALENLIGKVDIPQGGGIVSDFEDREFLDSIIKKIGKNGFKLFGLFSIDLEKEKYLIEDVKKRWDKLDKLTGDNLAILTYNSQYIQYSINKSNISNDIKKEYPSIIFFTIVENNGQLKIGFTTVLTLRSINPVSVDDLEMLFTDITKLLKSDILLFDNSKLKDELNKILKKHTKFDVKITDIKSSNIESSFAKYLTFLKNTMRII